MSRIIAKGATSQSIYVEILDSASTSGGRKTGIVYNSAGLTAYYVRNGGSATAITLATLAAANSAYSSGGFKEVDATNMPGVYRLDLPDAAVASGADSVVVTVKGASGAAQVSAEIQLSPAVDLALLNGDPTAAANLAKTTRAIGRGTVTTAATTTSIPTSAFSPAIGVADQVRGRVITFDADTTTAALRGQSTDITASSNSATPTLTVTALTTAPASGDTFSVT